MTALKIYGLRQSPANSPCFRGLNGGLKSLLESARKIAIDLFAA